MVLLGFLLKMIKGVFIINSFLVGVHLLMFLKIVRFDTTYCF